MRLLRRLAGWNQRFWLCLERLGLRNTLVIFFLGRLPGRMCTLKLPDGLQFHFEGGHDRVVCHFYLEGLRLVEGHGPPVRRIVDAGANIGAETARFLLHHPGAQIAAIEPAGRNFKLLERNFDGNPRVKVMHSAVWSEETALRVSQYGADMQEFRVQEAGAGETVPALTIPGIMRKLGWEAIDVLKLDIEGAEFELFTRNSEEWVGRVNAFVFEVPDHERPGTTQAIFRALAAFKYNAYVCGEDLVLVRQGIGWTVEKVLGIDRGTV
jgi:FkbM family methyltransferase